MKNNHPGYTRVTIALSIVALISVFASFVHAQGKQNFTLVNKTGMAITELYVSKASADEWEEDILGRDTLPNGESVEITFSPKERAAKWDVKLVDENGKDHKYYNLNLLEISEISVRSNGDGTWHWNWK
jgi:hypothetical protein